MHETGRSEKFTRASLAKEKWRTLNGFFEAFHKVATKQKGKHNELADGGPSGNSPHPMCLGVSY